MLFRSDADEWAYWRKQVNAALTPMEALELKVLDLDEAFEKGYVTGEEYFKILGNAFGEFNKKVKREKATKVHTNAGDGIRTREG